MNSKVDPMTALRLMEARRADDPSYNAHRAHWRRQHAIDARKMMVQFFAIWMLFQSCIAFVFGDLIVHLMQALVDAKINGPEVFIGVTVIVALFTFATFRSTYR